MKYLIHNKFKDFQERIVFFIDHFLIEGKILVNGQRNIIKLFEFEEITLSIKSFKKPNLINKIVYRYFI